MRKYCKNCCRKHLAQAMILMEEARHGHPEHQWLAIGHLAEASSEIEAFDMGIAMAIRDVRKAYEKVGVDYPVNLLTIIEGLSDDERSGNTVTNKISDSET